MASAIRTRTEGNPQLSPADRQPAIFTQATDGTYHPHGVHVLSIVGHRIARIIAFLDPSLVATFGYDEMPHQVSPNP